MHIWRPVILLVPLFVASSAAAQGFGDRDVSIEELEALAGKWVAVEGQQGEKELTPEQLAAVHFSSGGFTIEPFGRALFRLHPKQRQFSFLYGQIGFKAEGRGLGAYEVDGDTLRVAMIKLPPGLMIRPLPTSYAEALEQAHTVLKFRRSRP